VAAHQPVRETVPELPDRGVLGALTSPHEPVPERTRRELRPFEEGSVEILFLTAAKRLAVAQPPDSCRAQVEGRDLRCGCRGCSGGEKGTRRWAMRQILLIVTAVLLVLVLSVAVAGCRKSSGKRAAAAAGTCRPLLRAPCQLPPSPDRESTSRRSCGLAKDQTGRAGRYAARAHKCTETAQSARARARHGSCGGATEPVATRTRWARGSAHHRNPLRNFTAASWAYASGQRQRRLDGHLGAF
jgi:hypothetical protein